MNIVLRSETKPYEQRTPLTPMGAQWLLNKAACTIYVESSRQRIFKDLEYQEAGCTIVKSGFWKGADSNTLVLGIKELEDDDTQLKQTHIYFAHAYRDQIGSKEILRRFSEGGGGLLDLEYLTDSNGRRLISFSSWAGYIGAALGFMVFLDPSLRNLKGWQNLKFMRKQVNELMRASPYSRRKIESLSVAITGVLGRAGQGALQFFKEQEIAPIGFDLGDLETADDKQRLLSAQIIVHCVGGNKNRNLNLKNEDLNKAKQLKVISDVTCDYTSDDHMFPFYQKGTNFLNPTFLHKGVRIIAIDHLPSLLPYESSVEFSNALQCFLRELIALGVQKSLLWNRAHDRYLKALRDNLEMEGR